LDRPYQVNLLGFSENSFLINTLYRYRRPVSFPRFLGYKQERKTATKECAMRDRINEALKQAVKGRQARRTATLRLVNAAIKDRDIDARGEGKEAVSDTEIFQILQKMVKQRQESARIYKEAGRDDLETQELEEIEIIAEFLPQPLNDDEVAAAIDGAISETGAEGLRDMGKVVGVLKAKFPGRIDFGRAAKVVKGRLAG
jgi:uncharacterized protein